MALPPEVPPLLLPPVNGDFPAADLPRYAIRAFERLRSEAMHLQQKSPLAAPLARTAILQKQEATHICR